MLLSVTPNDPQFDGTGDPTAPPGLPSWDETTRWHHAKIDTPAAWQWFQDRDPQHEDWGGEGVVVAVVDTSFSRTHPDLNATTQFVTG